MEFYVQGEKLNMAVFFWYLVKSDLPSVNFYTGVHLKSRFLQGTRKKGSCLGRHPVSAAENSVVGQDPQKLRIRSRVAEKKSIEYHICLINSSGKSEIFSF